MKRKLLGLVILALLLLLPLALQAATAGKFTSVEGNVDVTSPGQEAQPAKLGALLNAGDIIRTKSKAKCEVSFPDGSIIRLAENTRLRIDEFAQEKSLRNATLNLFRGKIQNIVQAVTGDAGKQSKYEIHTPTAVTGVRGTDFFAYYQAGVTGAIFKEGTGYGYSLNRPQEVQTINPGQAMIVVNANLPPVVRPATALEIDQHQKDTAPSEKPKSEGKQEEQKKSETVTTKADEGKKEEQKKEEQKAETTKPAEEPQKAAEAAPADTGKQAKAEEPPKIVEASAQADARERSGPVDIVAKTMQAPGEAALSTLPATSASSAAQTPLTSPTSTTTTTTTLTSGSSGTGAVIVVPIADNVPPAITQLTPDNFSDATRVTNQSSATFTVVFNEQATISYSLDGSSYVSASGDKLVLTELPAGSHTVSVKGTDAAGNVSPATNYTWTTDYTPPTITLTGTPNAITNAKTADIGVSANKQVTYTYTLNGATVTSTTLTNLPEGNNTFSVTATDLAGNTSTKTYAWTTDYTPPTITLAGTPNAITNVKAANIAVSANKQVTYTYTLNGATVTSPNLTNLPEGSNSFVVTATDQAGNTSTKTYAWTTDYTPPTMTITPQVAPAANSKTEIKVDLAGNEKVTFTSLLDTNTTPLAGATLELKDLAPGSHTVKVEATDEAGNKTTQTISFNLDRYPLLGKFSGSLSNASGSATGELANISGQSWGGWNLDLTGTGKTSPDPAWKLSAGGRNTDGSFWLDTADLTTDATAKTLTGSSNLTYLSKDSLGSGTGNITGLVGIAGQYTLSDVGNSYTQQPLRFLSNITANRTGGLAEATNSHSGTYRYADGSRYSYQYFDQAQLLEAFYFPDEMTIQKRQLTGNQGLYYQGNITHTYNKGGLRTVTAYYVDPLTSTGITETRMDSWDPARQEWLLGNGNAITKGTWDPQAPASPFQTAIPAGYTSGPQETTTAVRSLSSDFTGLFGGTGLLWTAAEAPAAVTIMGTYGLPLTAPGQVWGTKLTSVNYGKGNGTTYDGGAYSGYLAGSDIPSAASPGQRGLDGLATALYIDPSGNAGVLTGHLAGSAYPDTGMLIMNGSLARMEMQPGIGILPENLAASLWSAGNADDTLNRNDYRSRFSGNFNGSGQIDAPQGNLDTLSIVNYDTHVVQPWGIYKHYLAGTFTNPTVSTSWSGMDGGQSAFGPYNAYRQTAGIYTYGDGGYYSYKYNDLNTGGTDYYRLNGTAYTYISTRYRNDGTTVTCTDGICVSATWTPATTSLATTLPTPPDTGYTSSTTNTKPVGGEDVGYWLAKATGSNDSDTRLTGTLAGRFITYTRMGDLSGNVLGNYDPATNTWQAASVGTYSGKPLLYANRIEGDLYQQNKAKIHVDHYEKPWVSASNPNGPLSTLRAETSYVISQNPANLPKYGWQGAQRQVIDGKGVRSDNFDSYNPNDEALSFSSNNNVPRMSRTQISGLPVRPDFSTSPPTLSAGFGANITPDTFLGNAPPTTTPVTVATNQYAETFESNYDLNVMERVLPPNNPAQYYQTFQGIMGVYQLDGGTSSLWSTDSAHPLGLSFLGSYQEAALPLVFRLRRFFSQNYAVNGDAPSPTADGGAYFGIMSGTLSSDRTLGAALYGLYVSPKNTDGTWEAGILKTTTPLTGSSYAGINMWEAAGQLYRNPKAANLSAPSMEASHLLDLDASGSVFNILRGALGDATVTTAGTGFGSTLSIRGLPDFGIFELLHGGIPNTYNNPGAIWRLDMASTGQFGQYVRSDSSTYNDSGFWMASINNGSVSSDKLSGALNGYFLTYKKEGTLAGDFLGNLKPDTATTGIWQGASAGTWEKTRDVAFSSGIVGSNFLLNKQINGKGSAPNNYYNIALNQNGSVNYAGFFSTSANGLITTRTEYNQEGLPGQEEYIKTVWVQDKTSTSSTVYQLQETSKLTDSAAFAAAIDVLRTQYKGSPYNYIENTDSYWMGQDNQVNGIVAGFDNPWNTVAGPMTTNLSLIGQYGQSRLGVSAPTVFGGTIISFNPMYSLNPYYNATSNPNGSRSPLGGAYYGYVGAAFGKQTNAADWVDGLINGLYRDPSGNVGIFFGKFTGNNNPQVAAWTGTGTLDGSYFLGTAGSGLTEANFANSVSTSSGNWSYGTGEVTLLAGDSVNLRAVSSNNTGINNNLLSPAGGGGWGVWQSRVGGTFSGTPGAWKWQANQAGNQTDYMAIQLNATEVNGVKTGSVVGTGVSYDGGSTAINGGTIKGLFDPISSTWQAIAQGIGTDTATFVNKVSSMTDDAQRQAFTDATKIPAFTVGTTDLRGSGNVTGGTINLGNATDATKGIVNAAFYASSTGGVPQIWASGNVNGTYTAAPTGSGTVSLSGYAPGTSVPNGITADFNLQKWAGTKWGATVTNGSVPAGTSGFTYPNAATAGITFQGGAAGSINAATRTFGGTAAGIVK